MKTIWKFPLQVQGEQIIPMPVGAEILSVQLQFGIICLWALVETGNSACGRIIRIVGTGNEIPEGKYVASVIQGDFVWHIFEGDI